MVWLTHSCPSNLTAGFLTILCVHACSSPIPLPWCTYCGSPAIRSWRTWCMPLRMALWLQPSSCGSVLGCLDQLIMLSGTAPTIVACYLPPSCFAALYSPDIYHHAVLQHAHVAIAVATHERAAYLSAGTSFHDVWIHDGFQQPLLPVSGLPQLHMLASVPMPALANVSVPVHPHLQCACTGWSMVPYWSKVVCTPKCLHNNICEGS
jgi:hypothetical protein